MTRRSAALQLVFALSFCHVALSQHIGIFAPTGELLTARTGHTATLLPDGKVLITGGTWPGSTFPSSAELYDPSTGNFTATGDMTTARHGNTATLLPDGKVLIVGGTFQPTPGLPSISLASAELYDPATGAFSPTGSMAIPDFGPAAIPLNNGKVLIVHSHSVAAELYDPVTGTFSGTGNQLSIVNPPTAALLPDGRVLLTSSCGVAQLYDPANGTFSRTDYPTRIGCDGFAAAALTDGTVLFAGGYTDCCVPGGYSSGSALYDPSSESVRPTGDMTSARENHTATLFPDGTVLIAGGQGKPFSSPPVNTSAEIYDPATGAFSLTGDMTGPRELHAATLLLDGRVLLTGGYTPDLKPASAELYSFHFGAYSSRGGGPIRPDGCSSRFFLFSRSFRLQPHSRNVLRHSLHQS